MPEVVLVKNKSSHKAAIDTVFTVLILTSDIVTVSGLFCLFVLPRLGLFLKLHDSLICVPLVMLSYPDDSNENGRYVLLDVYYLPSSFPNASTLENSTRLL